MRFWPPTALALYALLSFTPFLQAFENPREQWDAARRYASEGRKDFAYLELRGFVRRAPEDAKAAEARFGVAEYELETGRAGAAEREFAVLRGAEGPVGLLAEAYFLLCARRAGRDADAARAEESLKARFSSSRYLELFGPKKAGVWTSPIGNRFEFRESVDRLEIRLNGAPFHTIQLP